MLAPRLAEAVLVMRVVALWLSSVMTFAWSHGEEADRLLFVEQVLTPPPLPHCGLPRSRGAYTALDCLVCTIFSTPLLTAPAAGGHIGPGQILVFALRFKCV